VKAPGKIRNAQHTMWQKGPDVADFGVGVVPLNTWLVLSSHAYRMNSSTVVSP